MGQLISNLVRKLFGTLEGRIVMLGLDASGKTTVLYKLKLGETVCTIPTIGFNVERVQISNINFTVWDVGGQDKIRPLWRYYLDNINCVIFLVDSNDTDRIFEAKEELDKLMREPLLEKVPFLVLCNKQDLPHSMSVKEITEKLELQSCGRSWKAQAVCALTGDGLHEGFDWVASILKKSH